MSWRENYLFLETKLDKTCETAIVGAFAS